jgi:UDP-N-acetylglucosamine 2-epimerase
MHGELTGKMLIELERLLVDERPNLIIVFGDTNTTLAGALAGAKMQIPIVHVEAGLRSFNRSMPEEINRVIADHTSDLLFAPTLTAMSNLKDENLASRSYLTGDIMVDAHISALNIACYSTIIDNLGLKKEDYYLLTLHRPYNVDQPENLSSILNEMSMLSKQVVFPVHPRTSKIIEQNQLLIPKNIRLIKPVGYLDFVRLQADSSKIITDSGGIQKEAYILRKPCVTLRSETEWVETVEAGWNILIKPLVENGYAERIESFEPTYGYENIFGENVAKKMVGVINEILSNYS